MAIMTVFTAQPFDGDFGRAMLIEDQRSGDIWEENVAGWSEIIEVDTTKPETKESDGIRSAAFPAVRYYRHTDGRVALPA